MSPHLEALESIGDWGAAHVAAAVLDASGPLAVLGAVEHLFPLASVTKLATALCCLVALEEGTIALEDPLGPPGSTVAHLLAHASGLGPDDATQRLVAPGTRRVYSNAGFELLAAHLAERSEMGFGEYLDAAVLEPLAMTRTVLVGSAASGLRAPLVDVARLALELLAPSLVDAATLGRARAVAFPGLRGVLPGFGPQDPCDWGLGLELKDAKAPHWTGSANSPATFGHFGQSGTFVWVDPVAGLACVALSDRPFGKWAAEAWPALSDAVLAAHRDGGPRYASRP